MPTFSYHPGHPRARPILALLETASSVLTSARREVQLGLREEVVHGFWLVALSFHEHLHQVLFRGVGLCGRFLGTFVDLATRVFGVQPVGDLWSCGFLALQGADERQISSTLEGRLIFEPLLTHVALGGNGARLIKCRLVGHLELGLVFAQRSQEFQTLDHVGVVEVRTRGRVLKLGARVVIEVYAFVVVDVLDVLLRGVRRHQLINPNAT